MSCVHIVVCCHINNNYCLSHSHARTMDPLSLLNYVIMNVMTITAVVHGNGVYFARHASYSSRNVYSPPDANGYKYMYYVRVLTGEYTTGKTGLLVPPSKDPSNSNILFDSVVDNLQSPNIFVTFSDASNYPDYLIVFN